VRITVTALGEKHMYFPVIRIRFQSGAPAKELIEVSHGQLHSFVREKVRCMTCVASSRPQTVGTLKTQYQGSTIAVGQPNDQLGAVIIMVWNNTRYIVFPTCINIAFFNSVLNIILITYIFVQCTLVESSERSLRLLTISKQET
jgi:hypothetical protein